MRCGTRIAAILPSLAAAAMLMSGSVLGAEIHVMMSGGFSAAYRTLAPEFERATHHKLVTVGGPSMGSTPEAIPNRLQRGEPADVLIMVGTALAELVRQGKVVPGSRVELARSGIGMAVRAGAPNPDIGSVEAFKRTLLAARSIAYSDSASGVYISTVLYRRLGLEDQLKGKSRMIPGEPVGLVVSRGEAEIGFQQISELLPISGIQFVGPLPPEIQRFTVFSAGIAAAAKEREAAKSLIEFLSSPAAASAISKSGMEPVAPK